MIGLDPVVRTFLRVRLERDGKLELTTLQEIWPFVAGKAWSRRTRPVRLSGAQLELAVPDAVWLQEAQYQRKRFLERLNRLLPENVPRVTRLTVRVGRAEELPPLPLERPEVSARSTRPPLGSLEDDLAAIDDLELRELVARVAGRLGPSD